MKKHLPVFLVMVVLLFTGCKNDTDSPDDAKQPETITYEFNTSTSLTNLPALQSFVFGKDGKYWLIFGGRINGFHGFGSQMDFPFKKANKHIYVFNTQKNELDSMSVNSLPAILREQYTSSNMQHFQDKEYLYVSGGYGEMPGPVDSATSWVTFPTFSRVDVPAMIKAVLKHDTAALSKSVVYDQNYLQRATGGELFRLGDKFYLVVGHNFTGAYGYSGHTQKYLDSVHVFEVNETKTSISIDTSSFQYISDNLPDSITQFRRRDLLVVPAVAADKSTIGLTIYGGVFTSPALHDTSKRGLPFRNPIYLKNSNPPAYTLDQSYTQRSNIYSSAYVTMYDSEDNIMYTTSFGGMGDTLAGAGDAFTKLVLTIAKDNNTNTTHDIYNADPLPVYIGSESEFIPAVKKMYNDDFEIIDYRKLPENEKVLLGYIYGGINSKGPSWDGTNNPTTPSKTVYEVYITRNVSKK